MENKDLGVASAAQPPLSHPFGAEPVPVSGKAGIANAQHTPGPWEVYPQPISGAADAILELIEQVQSTSPLVDHLYLINAGGKCPALTGCGPTSEANARLIAAAPEMFEALEDFSREFDGFEDGTGEPDPVLLKARAAIAKARGQ